MPSAYSPLHQFEAAEQKYLDVLQLDPGTCTRFWATSPPSNWRWTRRTTPKRTCRRRSPSSPTTHFASARWENLRFRQAKYDAALDALSRAAQLKPDDAEIQNFLGVTLSQKGQRTAAEAHLRKAIQLDPQYGSAHNNLAVIYLTQNPPQIELARWHYQKALAAGQPRNEDLEKMLDSADRAANGDTNTNTAAHP